jgi:putative membrane protein
MRKQMILASTLLMTGGLMFAQAPAAGAGNDTNSAATPTHETAKPTAAKSSKKMDDMFARKAAEGGMAEVELGKLAAGKATNPDVKAFAQRMVDDHTKAGDQLKSIVGQANIQLPTDVNAKDKAEKGRLSKLSGAAFDRAYINHMVIDHKKDVADFQKEAKTGQDDAIKNFAQQTLPTLQDHLKAAQDAQMKVKGSASATNAGKTSNSTSAQ